LPDLGELCVGGNEQLAVSVSVLEEPVGFGRRRHRWGLMRAKSRLLDPDLPLGRFLHGNVVPPENVRGPILS
jgi:hypothetical protein